MMSVAGRLTGPEWQHYSDPATEFDVLRLTGPAFTSGMTAPHLRQFGRRGEWLLYWSERDGTRQAFQLDLRMGGSKQLTAAASLDPASLSLAPDERSFFFFDGSSLNETVIGGLHTREIYKVPDEAVRTGMTVTAEGSVLFAERLNGQSRIIRVTRQHTPPAPVDRPQGAVDLLMARPRHAQLLYRSDAGAWLINNDGSGKRPIKLAPGQTGEMLWTPSGRTLTYLHIPDESTQLVTLREYSPDDDADHEVARTSQFATAAPNGDASVFVGASRSKATAYVLLLLRVTRRELAICEHRASDPRMVSPIFSPDSQSVFFVTDRDGKPALYSIRLEKFVEQTGQEAQ